MVSWCSWLSHLSNTQKVPRSSLGEIIIIIFWSIRSMYHRRKQSIVLSFHESSSTYQVLPDLTIPVR
ncbi:hypothetical protein BDD12DRAFT_323266 [Trichophaea hybrida]|nr:hypothetical protein BDD12DRAFT_323266 [Trichophaea hybrida]